MTQPQMQSAQTPDYNKVLSKVEEVLRENYVIYPPVRIDEIAKNYGLTIFETDFEENPNIAGVIDPKTKRIYVNKEDSGNRKTFTIAHELGHWLLHREELEKEPEKYAILYRKPLGKPNDDPLEKEANAFAAHLLVPKELLKKFYTERKYDINIVAEIFGVSSEVIGYRLEREGLNG